MQVDPSETIKFERGCTFQLVDSQVLSIQGQPDVFSLHRLTRGHRRQVDLSEPAPGPGGEEAEVVADLAELDVGVQASEMMVSNVKALPYLFFSLSKN